MGLCYAFLEKTDDAMSAFRHALRYALVLSQTQNSTEEALACGQLGRLGMKGTDQGTALACMQRYLEFANMSKNYTAESTGYKMLADIALSNSHMAEATHYYETALKAARQSGDKKTNHLARLDVAVARGSERYSNYMMQFAKQIGGPEGNQGSDTEHEE
eukprot:GFYU01013073.1.p1 GENE.GFYU01013073.1~~GFYU01013073.1.p1  ORF type:complete len:171 (+),score=52.24 GFYU01013073.1:35-514(+)